MAGATRGKGQSFEDLRIFTEARELANRIYEVTRTAPFSRDFSLVDQMRRSGLSILSNIAEGYERETDAEFARFLYIAKASCGELRAQVLLACDQRFLSKQDFEGIHGRCRKLSVGIYRLIQYLQKPKQAKSAAQV